MTDDDRHRLNKLQADVDAAEAALESARLRRDEFILELRVSGRAGATEMAKHIGVGRRHVCKIVELGRTR